jgi:polysaccharide biosynthesis transport protein
LRLNELLDVLWRRKLVVVLITVIVVAIAAAAVRLVTPVYEATSTLSISPREVTPNAYFYFGGVNTIMPIYADAATSRTTHEEAKAALGRSLAPIHVDTFKDTPLMKIVARSSDPRLAQQTAMAIADALVARANSGDVGVAGLDLKPLDRPAVPTVPVFPNKRLSYIVAALLGVALGVGVALLRESLTTKVESSEDLARIAGVPSFGEIPAENAVERLRNPEALATEPRLRVVGEALRDLRTNLLFSDVNLRSLVITSPDGSHGKTTIAAGLAMTLARAGTKTLLIDGDLRRGRIADLLGIPQTPGLMEVLLGDNDLNEAIHSTSLETLDVLTGGRRGADPTELLTVSFPLVLSELEQTYETVVIDSTPVVPISDARIMGRFADAVVLVASAGSATRRQVRTAIERLSLISIRPTAVVLNNSKTLSRSSYYILPEQDPRTVTTPPKAQRTARP